MIIPTNGTLRLECDRCGAVWGSGPKGMKLRDDAKSAGWRERHRYHATRDYCPQCNKTIEDREQTRKGKR